MRDRRWRVGAMGYLACGEKKPRKRSGWTYENPAHGGVGGAARSTAGQVPCACPVGRLAAWPLGRKLCDRPLERRGKNGPILTILPE